MMRLKNKEWWLIDEWVATIALIQEWDADTRVVDVRVAPAPADDNRRDEQGQDTARPVQSTRGGRTDAKVCR